MSPFLLLLLLFLLLTLLRLLPPLVVGEALPQPPGGLHGVPRHRSRPLALGGQRGGDPDSDKGGMS